jgi:hypothetical protein
MRVEKLFNRFRIFVVDADELGAVKILFHTFFFICSK